MAVHQVTAPTTRAAITNVRPTASPQQYRSTAGGRSSRRAVAVIAAAQAPIVAVASSATTPNSAE